MEWVRFLRGVPKYNLSGNSPMSIIYPDLVISFLLIIQAFLFVVVSVK